MTDAQPHSAPRGAADLNALADKIRDYQFKEPRTPLVFIAHERRMIEDALRAAAAPPRVDREAVLAARPTYTANWARDIASDIEAELSDLTRFDSANYEIARFVHALALLPARESEWQPIETAPKTTKAILIWVPTNQCTYEVSWHPSGWIIFGGGWRATLQDATHWMPLPAPPTTSVPSNLCGGSE